MKNIFCRVLWFLLLCVAGTLMAQSDTARIVGSVSDSTGAVIPNATVSVTNTQTGQRTDAKAQSDGSYTVPSLHVGTYSVAAEAQGFSKTVISGIQLNVNDVARVDVQLKPGQVSDVVEVTGAAPLVQTDTSSIGAVIDRTKIVNLPLNGRNFTQLATLTPGVVRGTGVSSSNASGESNNAETFRASESGGGAIASNGLREQNNNFQLDGIDNNESIVNTLVFFPPVEAMEEFRVLTANAPAEFGRGGGAIVNAVTRSGGNELHGSVFEFLRNSALDAKPYFVPKGTPKPLYIRNQYGATFGGPIVKNHTFFFIDYQALRQKLPVEAGGKVTVPTAKMRKGDFSELLNPGFTGLGKPITIYNPNTGTPFAGNIINIPLNPAAQAYLNAFPMPDLTNVAQQNFFTHRIRVQNFDDGDVRLDHRVSDRDQIFARYSIAEDPERDPGRIPGYQAGFGAGTQRTIANSLMGAYTHTFSPTVLNEYRMGWVRDKISFVPVNGTTNQNAALGIGGQAGTPSSLINGISLVGGGDGRFIEYLGDGGLYALNERSLQYSDALTWNKGRHTWKFGATLLQRHINAFRGNFNKGFYFFDDFQATPGNVPAAGRTGYEVSDMLIGRTAFTSVNQVAPSTALSWENGFYAQDDWRVSRRVTVNLGLRYEIFTPPYEEHNRIANYDPATQKLILPGNGVPRSTVNTDWKDWGPRVGLAWDVTGDSKTVMRASYGMFYALDRGGIANQLTQNPPFNVTQYRFNFGAVNAAGIAGGGQLRLSDLIPAPQTVDPSAPSLPDGTNLIYVPRNTRNTRVQQYNIGLERSLSNNLALTVAYVGTHGDDVTAILSAAGFSGGVAAHLQSVENVGNSRYNSLQVMLNQRAATSGAWKGLSYLASYTYGHANNNSPGAFPGSAAVLVQTDPGGLQDGPADYDITSRFTWAGSYALPFFANSSGATRAALHGWSLNSIVTAQTGNPFSVFAGFGRAKQTGDPGANTNKIQYINPTAFAPSTSTGDQSPRNGYRAPGLFGVDFSIFRNFKLTERTGFEFRSEFFNLFNHPQFGLPNVFCCGGTFGQISSIRQNSEREIQFGGRFTF